MAGVTDEQLAELAEQATEICGRMTAGDDPVVIEFAGLPKSGKSTVIDVLAHFFRRMEFSVHAPSEGASKRTPYHLKRDLVAYNTWTLNYAVSELLAAYHSVARPQLIIMDRGPFDSLAWLGVLRDRGELDPADYETMKSFALLPRHTDLIDRLYLFTCEPEVSLQRETAVKLTRRGGVAMNERTLDELLRRYRDMKGELESYPVVAHDTSSTASPLDTSYVIARDILGLFQAKLS